MHGTTPERRRPSSTYGGQQHTSSTQQFRSCKRKCAHTKGLPELSVESIGRIFSDEKVKQAYDAEDSDQRLAIEFTAIKPALDRLLKAMRMGYRAQGGMPLKEDIAAFVSKQKNKGTVSVISRADCKILEKLLLAEEDSNVDVGEQGSEEGRVPAAQGKGKGKAVA